MHLYDRENNIAVHHNIVFQNINQLIGECGVKASENICIFTGTTNANPYDAAAEVLLNIVSIMSSLT